jgi:peptidyl-prolyl isomerase H (cyclophilin H)
MVEAEEYEKLVEDGGVTKKVLVPGYGEGKPGQGQVVIILFACRLPDGKVVDSVSDPRWAAMFRTDSETMFKGMHVAVLSMKRGEVARYRVKAPYAFGDKGNDKVPANSDVELEIEMLDFHDHWRHMIDLTDKERLEFTKTIKATGNEHFKEKRLKAAAHFYSEGITYIETLVNPDYAKTGPEVVELRRSLYLNQSVVCNSLSDWHSTIKYCTSIIEKEPNVAKARYLRGVALFKVGRYDEALGDLKEAHRLSPDDAKVVETMREIQEFKAKQKEIEKKKYQKIFASEHLYQEVNPRVTTALQKFPPYDPSNPRVFFELKVGPRDSKMLIFELIKTKVPKTVENFRVFCTGEKVHPYRPYTYKDSYFHRVIKNFMIQGGDIQKRDGTGGYSIYGDTFDDENFYLPHSQAGILSMTNQGKKNTNGCQFFITFKKTPWCDGKNVAFGRLIKGFDFLLNELQVLDVTKEFQIPKLPIKIVNCGEYTDPIEPELPPKKKKPPPNPTVSSG